jgi:hypothetical protein
MLHLLKKNKSARKRQLFCLACWAHVPSLFKAGRGSLKILEEYCEKDWFQQSYSAVDVGEHYNMVEEDLTSRFWDRARWGEEEIIDALQDGTDARLTSWNARSVQAGAVLTTTMTALFSSASRAHVTMMDFDDTETPSAAKLVKRIEGNAGSRALTQWRKSRASHADLVREVFGNPFRRRRVPRSCKGEGVRQLAQTIYEKKAFKRMHELADAIEAAGCKETDILNHCRSAAKHVRGCWLVDLLLEKA